MPLPAMVGGLPHPALEVAKVQNQFVRPLPAYQFGDSRALQERGGIVGPALSPEILVPEQETVLQQQERTTMPLPAVIGAIGSYVAGAAVQRFVGERSRNGGAVQTFTGPTNETYGDPTRGAPRYVDPRTGKYCGPRRRRRQLLTASDKNDITFLRGTLGGGELGKAAITALLTRRSS